MTNSKCVVGGVDSVLGQIAQEIYANFHKPSWQTSKRHLFMEEIPKKLRRELENIADEIKGWFQTRKGVRKGG